MSALLSDCGTYRYSLTRKWIGSGEGRAATFVMLNPSTADATEDDPTIRRCIGYAQRWGCDSLRVVNLYALRATDPRALWVHADPVGPDNDQHLLDAAYAATVNGWPLIAAWGANAKPDRVARLMGIAGKAAWTALGVTKDGAPRHPLYLRADAEPTAWRQP